MQAIADAAWHSMSHCSLCTHLPNMQLRIVYFTATSLLHVEQYETICNKRCQSSARAVILLIAEMLVLLQTQQLI